MPGEGAVRREVDVAGEDRADVGALDDLAEAGLVAQLHHDRAGPGSPAAAGGGGRGSCRGARGRRAPPRASRAGAAELAVVVTGDGRVHRDDPEPVDVVHAVDRAAVARLAEELATERGAVVVVAHAPDDLRAEARRGRLDDRAQQAVGLRVAVVGEVAGEDDRLRAGARGLQIGEDPLQAVLRRDGVVEPAAGDEQVRVTQVQQEVVWTCVLRRPAGIGPFSASAGQCVLAFVAVAEKRTRGPRRCASPRMDGA